MQDHAIRVAQSPEAKYLWVQIFPLDGGLDEEGFISIAQKSSPLRWIVFNSFQHLRGSPRIINAQQINVDQ